MSYQLIKPELNDDISITLWCRDKDFNKRKIRVLGFKPRFYVRLDDPVPDSSHILDIEEGFEGVYGEQLKKIVCDNPLSIWDSKKNHGLRSKFDKHWEADVPFLREFLISLGITDGFTLLTNSDVVRYTDVIPSTAPSDKTLTVIFDIEVVSTRRFPDPEQAYTPITIVTLWDNQSKKYLTIIVDNKENMEWRTIYTPNDWLVVRTTDEDKLLLFASSYFSRVQPDVITGWNIDFDITYLTNRCLRKQIPLTFEGSCIFNMIEGYAIIHKRLGNRLKEVAEEDKLMDIYTEFKQEMWSDPARREEGINANKSHVQVLVIEDERRKIIPFFWGLKQFVGLEGMTGTTSHGVLVDTLFLRESKGRYILPSAKYGEEGKGFKGAIVLEPVRGISENVGAYDMSRYYPNIVIGFKISPDSKGELGPNVCKRLMKEREKFEIEMAKHKPGSPEFKLAKDRRDEIKYLLNSVWGYYGWSGSRIYEQPKAAKVAFEAREGLIFIKATAETHKLKVLYGDTDSILLKVGKTGSGEVATMLNEALVKYCETKSISSLLSIKLDRFYQRIILTDAKKRSAGWVTWENGQDCDYIEVKGWESIRRDASHLTRAVLPKVFDAILKSGTDGLITYLQETVKKIKAGEFDIDYLAINKQLHLENFETAQGEYYAGAVYGNKHLGFDLQPGDMIKMIPVKFIHGAPATNVLCYLDKADVPWDRIVIDYDHIITRTLKSRLIELLDISGLSWGQVEGIKDLKKVWG